MSQLLLPHEILSAGDILIAQLLHYISIVHVLRDKRHDNPMLYRVQSRSH